METVPDAAVVVGHCARSHLQFGVRVEASSNGAWELTWAFPLDPKKAGRERYGDRELNGAFCFSRRYPGCPHCGAKQLSKCQCGELVCNDGARTIICPVCNVTCEIQGEARGLKAGRDF